MLRSWPVGSSTSLWLAVSVPGQPESDVPDPWPHGTVGFRSSLATWRSGYAAACKAVYTGSIPVVAFMRSACKRAVFRQPVQVRGTPRTANSPRTLPERARARASQTARPSSLSFLSTRQAARCSGTTLATSARPGRGVSPHRRLPECREPVCSVRVGRVVEVAFRRRHVSVAHQPLDLMDLEAADRLRAERVAQVVESQHGQVRPFAGVQEPAVEPRAADRLARLGVVLEDQHLSALAVTERRERLADVPRHGDRPHPAALVAGVTASCREAVLEAQNAGAEVDVADLQARESR